MVRPVDTGRTNQPRQKRRLPGGDGGFDKQQTTPNSSPGLAPGFYKVDGTKGQRGGMPQSEGRSSADAQRAERDLKRDAISRRRKK